MGAHSPPWRLPDAPRFVLAGCFGEKNTGDEALLEAGLELLRRRWPRGSYVVFSDDPVATAAQNGVEALPSTGFLRPLGALSLARRGSLWAVVKAIGQCDCLVVTGGELLRTDFGLRATLSVFDRISLARLLGKPVLLLGVGAGVLEPSASLSVMRWASRRAAVLTREEESARRAAEAGIGIVQAASDLAFHLAPEPHGLVLPARPRVAISLRDPARTGSCRRMGLSVEEFTAGAAALAGRIADAGATPMFVPFSYAAHDDDRQYHRAVADLMPRPERAWLLEQELPPRRVLSLMGAMDVVVGMRLHACIFALSQAKPVVALAYDPKVRKQMDHFGVSRFCLPMEQVEAASVTVLEQLGEADGWGQKIVPILEQDRKEFVRLLDGLFFGAESRQ